jgi:hypothetical protein
MEAYDYVKENLIEKPNTYFYSSFFGYSFFISWRKQRKEVYDKLGGEASPPESSSFYTIEDIENMINSEVVETGILFEAVYGNLDKHHIQLASIISKLIKKFEVSKRWHTTYLKGLRTTKDSNDVWHLELYLRAAEIFEKVYIKFDNLPSFNVFLKLIDTLCSVAEQLDGTQKKRLARLIKQEEALIIEMAHKLNLQIV